VYNYFIMTTHANSVTGVKYPLETAAVNVHGDLKKLAESLDAILPAYGVSYFQINVKNNSGVTIGSGVPVYATGNTTTSGNGIVTIAKALPSTTSPILGLLKSQLTNGSEGIVVVAGVMEGVNTRDFSPGDVLYVGVSGGLTNVRPTGGSAAVGIVASRSSQETVNGIVIVEAKGNGTWGALRDGLS
jgi:hypothetical protein